MYKSLTNGWKEGKNEKEMKKQQQKRHEQAIHWKQIHDQTYVCHSSWKSCS